MLQLHNQELAFMLIIQTTCQNGFKVVVTTRDDFEPVIDENSSFDRLSFGLVFTALHINIIL